MPERDEDQGSPGGRAQPARARHKTQGRFARFARLSKVTAEVAARSFSERVSSSFRSEEEAEQARRESRKRSAEAIAETMGQLKGAAMKVGQMLSADPELLPEEMSAALSTLHAEAPPMDFATVKEAVEEALGGPLEDAFAWFSEEPVGAASIGQVHRATTHDGEDVAVKVQYPGIAATIESDMKNLGSLMNVARAHLTKEQVDTYLAEVTEVIKRESDYLVEADSLERFATVLKDVSGTRTPVPLYELCRPQLLTMSYVEGIRLAAWMEKSGPDERAEMAARLCNAYIEMLHVHGCLHADPHPGNFLVDEDDNLVFLDLGCVRDYDPAFGDGLIAVIKAMWRSDTDALMAALDEVGFDRSKIDPEVIHDWLELILRPLLVDEVFDFSTWKVQDKALAFMREHPSILHFAPPREAIFYLRVLGGIRGLVGSQAIALNVHRLAKDAVKRLGL